MWKRFQEKRYFQKAEEAFDQAKEIFNFVHQNGDSNTGMDLLFNLGELKMSFSHVIEMKENEKIQRAENIRIKAERLGDPKIVSEMNDFITSRGKIIPAITTYI
jgi:hypothetical protein